jgi:DNA-binding MurR/RpiR family transcriptional regulator
MAEPAPNVEVLERLLNTLPALSPQLKKAARYVLDNANHVAIGSIREIAEAAAVKPNTLVRMARAVGFEGYEDFRQPFRVSLRGERESFPERARWLQSIARGGRQGRLFSQMAAASIDNIEALFSSTTVDEVKAAADRIVEARRTHVLGVGILYGLAHNFAYLAHMAVDSVVAIPREGSLPIDDIARAGSDDVLMAMTFKPYRSEVVEAVRLAREQGVAIIAVTDSRSAPIAIGAQHVFVLPTDSPQFFTSMVAVAALIETIMAFVIADAGADVVANIEKFHQRRHDLGVYWREDD